jgi:hypothetical protein
MKIVRKETAKLIQESRYLQLNHILDGQLVESTLEVRIQFAGKGILD